MKMQSVRASQMKRLALIGACAGLLILLTLAPASASYLLGASPPAARAAPNAPMDTPELYVSDAVDNITLKDGTLFWKSGCGELLDKSRLRSIAAGGSFSNTLYYPATCQLDRLASVNVAVDDLYAYWLAFDGHVARLRRGASSGESPTYLITTTTALNSYIAVDNAYVYWTQNNLIYRAPKTGGSPELLQTRSAAVRDLRLGPDGRLYFIVVGSNTFLRARDNTPGGTNDLIGAGVTAYAFNSTSAGRVYWVTTQTGSANLEVRSVRFDLGGYQLEYTIDGMGSPTVNTLAVDTVNLYWQETRGVSGGPILRHPFSPGPVEIEALTTNLTGLSQLISSGRYLFWWQTEGIYRLPVNAAAMTLDLVNDGMEVIQDIQRPANDVPLVAEKDTIVRVYGHIGSSSSGLTRTVVWPQIVLTGTRGGVALEGSPLLPENSFVPLLDRAVNRTTLSEGFLFHLPPSWTQGNVTLVATLNPRRAARETTYANNTVTLTVSFVDKAPICLEMIPVRTWSGTIYSWQDDFGPLFRRAEAILPTPHLWTFWPGGSPIEKLVGRLGFPPWEYVPYSLTSNNDDSWRALVTLNAHDIFDSNRSQCNNARAYTHRVGMVPWEISPPAWNGIAARWALLFRAFTGDYYFDVPGFPTYPQNSGIGGVTLAHEIGHNYGRDHVNCPVGEPAGTDDHYPYPTCQIDFTGSSSHIGRDPISGLLLLPDQTGDLMSYAQNIRPTPKPRWPSDYTWEGIYNYIRTTSAAVSTEVHQGSPTRPTAGESHMVVMGVITPTKSTAEFSLAMDMAASPLTDTVGAVEAGTTPTTSFQLLAYKTGDILIGQYDLRVMEIGDSSSPLLPFMHVLTYTTDLAYLDLVDARGGTALMAELKPGANPPTMTISQPAGGDNVTDVLNVEWKGGDPDVDDLVHYLVRYSADSGATWRTIADTVGMTASMKTRGLPGSQAVNTSLIQVIGSDGIHTAIATSDPFTVQRHQPEVSILSDEGVVLNATVGLTATQGEAVVLHARGYDDEDGILMSKGLHWQVFGPNNYNDYDDPLTLLDLQPGAYAVLLTAADSDAMTATATTTLTVAPKSVRFSAAPVLDGFCDDEAYGSDPDPIALRYANSASGEAAQVRMIHTADALYACFSGLPIGLDTAGEFVGLRVDVNDSGDTWAQPDDIGFFVQRNNGVAFTARGDGTGGFPSDTLPQGLTAAVSLGETSWSAELRIDKIQLGGWNHRTRMKVSHYWLTHSGDDTAWPIGAFWNMPVTWGQVFLESPFQAFLPVVIR